MTKPLVDRETTLWRMIVWTLRVSVAIQCLGNAAATLTYGSKVHSLLASPTDVHGLGWSDATASGVDAVAAWCLLTAAVLILVRPCWPVLLPVALWEISLAFANTWLGGEAGSQTTMISHAVRIAAPIGLILLDPWPKRSVLSMRRMEIAFWIFRISVAAMFIAHGYQAIRLNPRFVDLLLMSEKNILDWGMKQQAAEAILYVIGLIDIGVALLFLGVRSRGLAFYMAIWGLMTAFSRLTAAGFAGMDTTYHQTLSRAAHAGVPLAVGLYWWLGKKARILSESTLDTEIEANSIKKDE